MSAPGLGLAGRVAAGWINSKLTPLVIAGSLLLGVFSVLMLPREEEPQIIVPLPGASAQEVEQRITRPMEKLLWEIPGVEYVYSTSSPGMAMVVVRFQVGQDEEKAIVRVNQKMYANYDLIPPGATPPLVKPRSIDDVPVLALTLHSKRYNGFELRRVAAQLTDSVKQAPDVSEVRILGGQRRELRVTLDAGRLAAFQLTPLQVLGALGAANQKLPAGRASVGNVETVLEVGGFLRDAEEAKNLVVAVSNGHPVYLRDVASVADTGEEPSQYVQFAAGSGFEPAVTISIAKRKGANAIAVADNVLRRVDGLKGNLLPGDIDVTVTRNYGETAAEKSNELLFHMGIAVVSVSLLVAFVLGFRESLIVFTAIPVTLALTLTVFYLYGYTLNRITLFALIFSIGILVDDAIVIVENIVRHVRMPQNAGRPLAEIAVEADSADGLRRRTDGTLHAAHSGGRHGGDDLLAAGCLYRHALGGHPPVAPACARPPRPPGGSSDRPLSPLHGSSDPRARGALQLPDPGRRTAVRLDVAGVRTIRQSENAAL